uniref:Neurofascin n=1 Tax=Myripristis murdjan TaxID=586833 RepID=A0A668A0M1_9TELE
MSYRCCLFFHFSCSFFKIGELADQECCWIPCTVKMGTLLEPAVLLLLWQGVWALDVPLEMAKLKQYIPLPTVRQPPTIIKQSLKEHIVDPKDTMVIECEAKGNPHPIFSWRRNGKYFNVARDSQTSMRRRSGTLDIYARNNPGDYEAEYQCIASNEYGSAYSNKIRLQLSRAPVWPREILEPVVVSVGLPLVLSCDPPPGPPKPETYWMSSCKHLFSHLLVSMGVNGDLYFSNVLINDSATDYCCNARFPYKNIIQQKMPVVVKVLTTRTVAEAAPTWLSPTGSSSSVMVLQGEELFLECIAAGVPTPHISWMKDGEALSVTSRMRVKNFNKMIKIPKASFDDAGEYVCTATNKIGYIEHTITVRVKAAPFWLERPSDLILAPEENGQLVCRSDGAPRPTIRWFINGEPIETATPQPNRHVSGETLTLRSVTVANTGVYQCNASNQYGYLFANAFVNVLHATPRIMGPRNELIKVIEGSRIFLHCRYFGSPVPDLRWSKYGQGNLEGNRFKTHGNGTLEIKRIKVDDQGTYLCIVSNIAGRDESQVRVEVKEPTMIIKRPQNMKVLRGTDVRFECGVKHDVSTPVTTSWMKNKKISLDESNLVITSVNRGDEGNYTCIIKTEMEQKSASAQLMVMDRPDPPTDLELSDPYERSVRLTWVPGDNNHSPITGNNPYDEDDWLPGKWRNLSTYPGNLNSVVLQLSPFTYYEFRVIATNAIGPSRPSRPSMRFQTSGAREIDAHKTNLPHALFSDKCVISWEPLTYREWNGPHLKYLVWWRRRDSREEWKNATTKWLKYYIYDADTFTPYELKVQAVNDFGLGPESPVVIGYSGEDREQFLPYLSFSQCKQSTYKYVYFQTCVLTPAVWLSVVPSVPRSFRIQQRHLDTIYVDWETPAEPNGIITGYSLKYQTVNATRGEELRVEEFPANVTSFSVRRYDRYTRYRFSLAARTQVGIGEWYTEESPHYTTEAYARDQVDITTQGWFIGIMCAVAVIVLILLIVCFIKRSRGGKYPVRDKKDISLEPVDDKDQEGSFDYREEERGLQRGQESVEAMMKRTDSDDSLVEYGEGGEIQFNEDGSFIGEYTGSRRDVREVDYGGSLELHSPMNAIYSLA